MEVKPLKIGPVESASRLFVGTGKDATYAFTRGGPLDVRRSVLGYLDVEGVRF